MNKIWSVLTTILGALSAFLVLSIRRKNKELENKDDEIKRQTAKAEQSGFIARAETEAKNTASSISSSSESDLDRLLIEQGAVRDRLSRD